MSKKLKVVIILMIGGVFFMIDKFASFSSSPVLPLVYDKSLSYEEQICKILYYINHSVVSDEELKETLNYINSVSVKSVSGILGYGSFNEPIDITCLGLTDNTCLYFSSGQYIVKGVSVDDISNLTLLMPEAEIICADEKWIEASNCQKFTVIGGTVNGDGTARYGIQAKNCTGCKFNGVTFKEFGNVNSENTSGLNIFGDCTGFIVEGCKFKDITAGIESSDGFIHSYGLLINRLASTMEYSKTGNVNACNFENIASYDTTRTGDGDGIFIQAPPYIEDGKIVKPYCTVEITNCYFNHCKKRGVKVATHGAVIRNCVMNGEYWFACIDLQYGHCYVEKCRLENKSDYNNSITSCFISADGGFTVKDCYMTAPYLFTEEDGTKTKTFHPGVRFDARQRASVIPKNEKWDSCYIVGCNFDGVSRGVFAYNSNKDADTYSVKGIHIIDCVFGDFNQSHCVDISTTMFNSIDVFEMIDFMLIYGSDRHEVAEKITRNSFTYPLGIGVPVKLSFEYYSKYWKNEPMSGYVGLPNAVHNNIVYSGDNMGGIVYKKYGDCNSVIYAEKSPNEITQTLAKQLLYNSRVGDVYINRTNGGLYVCTNAGTSSSIGNWTEK